MKKKICSLLLALMMMLSLVPSMAWGATSLGYTPYPKVQYSYTNSTPVGTIRYIAQNSGSEYFSWNYWPTSSFGGYSSPSTECGTACISMALSYVGVNRTPKELLESTNGYTGSMWGKQGNATSRAITISEAGISSAMNNYINGNGKYSPLCVYIQPFSATSSMHWVLLVGKISENTYLALNPWHSSGTNGTFTLQVNGSKATYNGTTNPITSVNQWYNASAEIAPHTCDRGSYVYYEAAHPHYKCYKCSICGKVWRDTSAPTKLTDCEQCYPRTATVTYYNADGAVWTTASGTADTSYTLSASYPTKSDSYFVGWSYTADASSFDLRPNDTVTLKGSIDLYPVYVTHEQAVSGEEVYIYNISDFDSDGYNISAEDHTVQTRVDDSGWSSWSDYSLTAATESATQQVRTTTMYRYYYFLCPSCGRHEPFTGKSDCGATITGSGWHEKWFTTPYASSNYKKFSYTTSKYYTTSLGDGQVWIFSAGNLNNTTPGTKDATGSEVVISTGYSTRQWNSQYKTVDYSATAYRITKAALASGTCGENLTWVLEENGTLTVSGAGEMYNYARDSEPWKDYQSSITTVYIENGVSSIGDCAFESCEALTDVTIADSVTSIGKNAFACCSGLTSVTIPSSVTSIGEYAFQYCSSLKTVAIPDGITSIKKGTFYNCTGLTDVTIGKNVENIESGAFEYCKGLTSVTIPSSVSSITGNPFSECKKLTSITVADDNPSYMSKDGVLFEKNGETLLFCLQGKEGDYQIPDSVKSINSGAFFNCDKLTGITVPNSVTNIQEGTFFGCSNLTSIVIPNSVTSIGEAAFSRCRNLTQMIIPDSVVSMGTQVFSECTELKSVTLSKNMTAIPFDTFLSCKSLTSVTIPDGVTSISASAFNYCAALSSVTIPDSVAAIGWAAFSNCSALTDVYYDGTEEQWKQVKIDNSNDENKCLNNATIHFVQPEPQPQPPVETSGTIAVSSVRARAGQTITVKVDLSANKGISNMRLQMSYPEGFTLESIQKGDALSTLFFTPPGKLTANPVNFVWDGTEADTSEGCILELTFRVADTVAVGEYSISLSYQKDDVLDGSLEGIDLALQSGTVSVVEFTRGDIDDDGVIGMKDLGALRKYFAGGYDAGNFVMEAADLDGDGVVTMKDLGVLRRYLAGGYDINLGE